MKKVLIAVGIASLLLLLTAQVAPAMAARDLKDITGYTLLDDKFAVRIDMNQKWKASPNENLIQMTEDLLVPTNPKVLSDGYEDDQEFYMAYANMDGIQAAYNALLKFEHNVSAEEVLEAFPDLWRNYIEENFDPYLAEPIITAILNEASKPAYNIGHINATAPFQTLVEHWRTLPDDQGTQAEMFVSNHYVALMAYSTTGEDQFLDSEDDLYLGYTFAFSYLKDELNQFIRDNTAETGDFIGDYNAIPFFNEITDGYEFGVEYKNLFVIWQSIDKQKFEDSGAIIFGGDIAAMTLLDSLTFTYKFTTQELGTSAVDPTVTEVWANIETTYDFGETNLLITNEDSLPAGGGWTSDSFALDDPTYTFDFPTPIVNLIKYGEGVPGFNGYDGFPESVTVQLPDLAFYLNDDAKKRIAWDQGGFGMIMTTMTNIFAVGLAEDPTHAAPDAVGDGLVNETIDILANDEAVFQTTFTDKLEYQLSETGIYDGLYDVRVEYWDAEETFAKNLGWFYFELETGLAWIFLNVIAKEMGLTDGHHVVDVDHSAYFTLTEYWRWNGGAISHDPTYTAISGKAGESTETDTASSDGAFTPGFEFLIVALAVIPLAAYKKRK